MDPRAYLLLFSSQVFFLPPPLFLFFFRVFEVKFKGGEEKAYIYIYLKKYAMDRYVYHDIFKEICIYLYMTSCGGIGARNERIAENSI